MRGLKFFSPGTVESVADAGEIEATELSHGKLELKQLTAVDI